MLKKSLYLLKILLVIALNSSGQNVDLTGINASLEVYRFAPVEYGIISGIRLNGALAGARNQPRLTCMLNQVPYTHGFYVDSYLSYDQFLPSLKGGIGLSVAYRGKMQEPALQLVYSPRFSSSIDRVSVSPYAGIGLEYARYSLDPLRLNISFGALVNSPKRLIGVDVQLFPNNRLQIKLQLGQSYTLIENLRASLLLHAVVGYEKYQSYLEMGERLSTYQGDPLHSLNQAGLMLVHKLKWKSWILATGLSHEWNTFEHGERQSEFYHDKRWRPIAQLGFESPQFGLLVGLRGCTLSYTWD